MSKVNWVIIGLGGIARAMATALKGVDNAVLYGVASRSLEKAEQYREEYGAVKAYASYQEALDDPKVDAVYISTPHPMHKELSIAAMKAGKAVLCEKPAAMNEAELDEVLEAQKETGMFFMEAMWTKFHPAYNKVMELVKNGAIGELKNVYADICCPNQYFPGSRLFEKELGGGACLDLGIYILTYALGAMSSATNDAFSDCKPEKFMSMTRKTSTGVDAFDNIMFEYKNIQATLTASIDSGCNEETRIAKLVGTNGMIEVRGFWYASSYKVFDVNGNKISEEYLPFRVNGYEYEAEKATECILKGKKECEIHTHADTKLLSELMDRVLMSEE